MIDAEPAAINPDSPVLDCGLTQRLGQVGDLGLELLFSRRRPGAAGREPGLAGLKEVGFPTGRSTAC